MQNEMNCVMQLSKRRMLSQVDRTAAENVYVFDNQLRAYISEQCRNKGILSVSPRRHHAYSLDENGAKPIQGLIKHL